MDPINTSDTIQSVVTWTSLPVAAAILAFFAKFMQRKIIQEDVSVEKAKTETDIVTLLHTELDRLAVVNTALSLRIQELQNEVHSLRSENLDLKIELKELKSLLKKLSTVKTFKEPI